MAKFSGWNIINIIGKFENISKVIQPSCIFTDNIHSISLSNIILIAFNINSVLSFAIDK